MKITLAESNTSFKSNIQDNKIIVNKEDPKTFKKAQKYVDPLANWPLRGLGYTNDIGIAINELAPNAARLFWVPALMYFGADVYDKYKNKGDKYNPNAQRAFSQAVFQAFASIIFPAVFGHIGMSIFSGLDKLGGDNLSTNAKEQVLRFIKSHAALHDVPENSHSHAQFETLETFNDYFNKYYLSKRKCYKKRSIVSKIVDKLLSNGKNGAIATSREFNIKNYAREQFTNILNTCENVETAKNVLDKKIFRLKAWKSAGAFTAILLTAKAIDGFVEKVIIKKFVEPQIKRFNDTIKINDFGNIKTEEIKEIKEEVINN